MALHSKGSDIEKPKYPCLMQWGSSDCVFLIYSINTDHNYPIRVLNGICLLKDLSTEVGEVVEIREDRLVPYQGVLSISNKKF